MIRTVKPAINLDDYDHSQWDGIIWVYNARKVQSHQDTTVRGKDKTHRPSWASLIKQGGRI